MTITVSTTDRRDGKALALFANWHTWQQGHTREGRPFFAIPGSEPNLYHMTDCRECSCPDFQRAGNLCKHVRAARLWMAAYRTGAVTPKSRPATPDVVDDAGTGDDLISLTPEGAAFLAALDEPDPPVTDETLATLAKLRADHAEHTRRLRLLGYAPDEYCENTPWQQRAEQIAKLESRIARAERQPAAVAV